MIIAGTGHRPKFLPCKYNEKHPWLLSLKQDIKNTLHLLKPNVVISGMAIGFDTWLAQVALEEGYKIYSYVPFKGQHLQWPTSSRKTYEFILNRADKVVYIDDNYSPDSFLKRDKAMVDAANEVIALWNPQLEMGGTFYTVKYALKNKKKVHNLWKE